MVRDWRLCVGGANVKATSEIYCMVHLSRRDEQSVAAQLSVYPSLSSVICALAYRAHILSVNPTRHLSRIRQPCKGIYARARTRGGSVCVSFTCFSSTRAWHFASSAWKESAVA